MSEKSSLYGETKYDYNKNGDLVCETGASSTRSYEYTVESRLKAVREGGEILMAAAYDGYGNRTLQVTRRERMIEKDESGSYEDVSSGSGEDVGSDDKKDAAKKDDKKEKKVSSKEDRESTQKEDISFNAFLYGFLHGLMEFFAELNSSLLTLLSDLLNNSFSYGSAGYTASDIKALSASGLSMSDIENITGIRRLEIVSEEDVIPEEESIEDKVFIPGKHYDIKETYYDLTEYVNDTNRDNTEVLEEYGQGGILKSTHVYGNERISTSVSATSDSIIADITGVATVRNDMSANDFNISSSAYDMSYLYDGRGSVAQTISGNVINGRFSYDPFGSTITKVSQKDNYYGYNAEETNSVTGLQYLRARYYNSDMGRFFNADTYLGELTDPMSQNRYTYTENNPVNYIDPTGHSISSIFAKIKNHVNAAKAKTNKNTSKNTNKNTNKNKKGGGSFLGEYIANAWNMFNNMVTGVAKEIQDIKRQRDELANYLVKIMSFNTPAATRRTMFEELIKKHKCGEYDKYIKYVEYQNTPHEHYRYNKGKSDPKRIWVVAIKHPIAASQIGKLDGSKNISSTMDRFASESGLKNAKNERGREVGEGSEIGALRHATWIAYNSVQYNERIAKEAADAHEVYPYIVNDIGNYKKYIFDDIDQADAVVDILNNQIGINEIAKKLDKKDSAKEATKKTLEYFHKNGLYVMEAYDGGYVVEKRKITKGQYEKALYRLDNELDEYGFEIKENKSSSKAKKGVTYTAGNY